MPFPLQSLGEMADGVIALAMHHHQRLLAAGDLENLKQLLIAQNQIITNVLFVEVTSTYLPARIPLVKQKIKGLGRR